MIFSIKEEFGDVLDAYAEAMIDNDTHPSEARYLSHSALGSTYSLLDDVEDHDIIDFD